MSTTKELETKVNDFAARQKTLQELSKTLATEVIDTLKSLMHSTPYIEAVQWRQYVPGFNDGDPCEFTVTDFEVKFSSAVWSKFNDEETGDNVGDDGFMSPWDVKRFFDKHIDVLNHEDVKELQDQYDAAKNLFTTLNKMEKELEGAFGTNVLIVVTQKGITTEDYDPGY